ncbi:MAG: serine hydrolase domain-containing protein, partial [Pseudomonadota bacterium]
MTDAPVSGTARPAFAGVKDAFAEVFADEQGGAFAVAVDGEVVVDLRAGWSDKPRERPWAEETIAGVYSTGKAATAILIAKAVEEGALDYEAPVANYWPEFAAHGKAAVTVAEALSHQAGLSGVSEPMEAREWLDHDAIAARLAGQAPLFPPREAHGYHPQTVGIIANELLRRTTDESIGAALRRRFPDLSLYCGMTPDEIARAAYMPKPKRAPDLGPMNEVKKAAFLQPWSSPAGVDRQAWMAAELPAANMHADARSFAELLSIIAAGGMFRGERFLGEETLSALTKPRASGPDLVLPFDLSW